jgi:hypothetical protein
MTPSVAMQSRIDLTMHEIFQLSSRISLLPVIHGSGDFAVKVRQLMLQEEFDLLAVPLPPSFQEDVETAIDFLPSPTMVIQHRTPNYALDFSLEEESDDEPMGSGPFSYVPIDPCQAVIAALRVAQGEHLPRAFIDRESEDFHSHTAVMPDPYALKCVRLDRFAAAMVPVLPAPPDPITQDRIAHMAGRLRALETRYHRVLALCPMLHWPWLRDAYRGNHQPHRAEDAPGATEILRPTPETLLFFLGELPFITSLYERARRDLGDDENLSVDGVKELLVEARSSYKADFRAQARRVTPHALSLCLRYVRNLTLLDRRMTPDLYNLVMSAKQVVSDSYALHVAEMARQYAFATDTGHPPVEFGVDRLRLPSGDIVEHVSRLPGSPVIWRSLQLRPRATKKDRLQWKMKWNPFSQCSWPPEDNKIEDFRTRVADRAKALMGIELAKTEKFTTSLKDGLDIRDTLRHWYSRELYVKVLPPSKGRLDAVVMLFDSPADPRNYPWRTTWFAEHQNESTLAFFATDFRSELVGPGIGMASYGGALFLYPPVHVRNIWDDPRLDFTETMEERLLAAACLHSQCPHIALLAPGLPGPGWRRLARRFGKKWVHLPLSSFSLSTIEQLRTVHVLNGHEVRSYAAHFIRKG